MKASRTSANQDHSPLISSILEHPRRYEKKNVDWFPACQRSKVQDPKFKSTDSALNP